MAPKLLWITIIHVLLWNFIFSLTESIELKDDGGLLLNKLGNQLRHTNMTHICDCLNKSPPVVKHNNYVSLPNSHRVVNSENSGLAKDLSEPSNPVKRHAILRWYNRPAQENNEPNKPDLITSEWQMKSTNKPKPVDLLYDRHVPPMAYRPTLPSLIHTPVIKPSLPPILLQKESPIPTTNERPQGNIGSTFQYPKIIKNGIAEPTS